VHSSRHLTWDGCVNVRDLGGLPTEDGAETTYGAVVRADYIGALSDAGRQALLEHGITRIVDLRWFAERVEDPPLEVGIETLHVPLFGDENDR
jgi:protein-tyrosine phosphatase